MLKSGHMFHIIRGQRGVLKELTLEQANILESIMKAGPVGADLYDFMVASEVRNRQRFAALSYLCTAFASPVQEDQLAACAKDMWRCGVIQAYSMPSLYRFYIPVHHSYYMWQISHLRVRRVGAYATTHCSASVMSSIQRMSSYALGRSLSRGSLNCRGRDVYKQHLQVCVCATRQSQHVLRKRGMFNSMAACWQCHTVLAWNRACPANIKSVIRCCACMCNLSCLPAVDCMHMCAE